MVKESNQISSKLEDWICFATLIHWGIYNEQKQSKKKGLEVVHSQEEKLKIQEKVGIGFQSTTHFREFQDYQSLPRHPRKLFQSFPGPEALRNSFHNSHGLVHFSNSIFAIYASLAHLIYIFLFIIMFASYWYHLIAFSVQESWYAIVRVPLLVLGVFSIGKIRPFFWYHDAREDEMSWLVPLPFIYIACIWFFECHGFVVTARCP